MGKRLLVNSFFENVRNKKGSKKRLHAFIQSRLSVLNVLDDETGLIDYFKNKPFERIHFYEHYHYRNELKVKMNLPKKEVTELAVHLYIPTKDSINNSELKDIDSVCRYYRNLYAGVFNEIHEEYALRNQPKPFRIK